MEPWVVGVSVFAAYLVVLLGIGWYSHRRSTHTLDDHLVGSRGFGPVVLTLTYAATFHSAYAFTGIVGFAYNSGVGFWVNGLYLIPPAFLFWHFGKRLWLLGKRYGFLTLGDYLSYAYNSRGTGLAAALIHTLFTAPYVAIQLAGSGYIFSTMTEDRISFELGAGIMLVVMLVYVLVGGLRAVAWTDTLQGVLMFVVIFAGGYYVVNEHSGSVSAAMNSLYEQLPSWFTLPGPNGGMSEVGWVTLWLPFTLGLVFAPQIVMRIFSARTLRVLKWSAVGGAIYLVTIYTFIPAVAAVGHLEFPGLDAAGTNQLFVDQLWGSNLPVIVVAIALGGGFAAAMSTADSQIHAVSATLAVDGYQKYFDKARDPVRTKRFTYFAHGVLALLAYLVIVTDQTQLLIDLLSTALTGVAILAPTVIGALYWKRGAAAGALASIIGGLLTLFATTNLGLSQQLEGVGLGEPIFADPFGLGVHPGTWTLAVGTVLYILVSLLARPARALAETQNFTSEYLLRAMETPQERAEAEAAARAGATAASGTR